MGGGSKVICVPRFTARFCRLKSSGTLSAPISKLLGGLKKHSLKMNDAVHGLAMRFPSLFTPLAQAAHCTQRIQPSHRP
jgi:hypothetical protein